jgi:hypothetical protein
MMTNVDILVNATERDGDKINPPNETLIEKVAFVFNNLCAINVNEKV